MLFKLVVFVVSKKKIIIIITFKYSDISNTNYFINVFFFSDDWLKIINLRKKMKTNISKLHTLNLSYFKLFYKN